MKIKWLTPPVCAVFVAFAAFVYTPAPVDKHEWYGQWNMNHDGHPGTLTISDSKADCATTPWCDMILSYSGKGGQRIQGSIDRIDDNLQHMVFYLHFPGNKQKFDAYIFSWDKINMAGTTYWNGRTFGFFANKKKNIGRVNNGVNARN